LTLAIALSVVAGFAAQRHWGEAAHTGARRALDAMLYLALPFITFFVIARTDLTTGAGVGIVLAYGELALVGTAAWAIAARALRLPPATAATVVIAAIMANTGFLGVPLNAIALGREALGPAITFDTLVSGPMFYVGAFAVAAAITTRGAPPRARLRTFLTRNPPLLAVAAALVAPDALAPDVLVDVAQVAVVALAPVGFFVLGVNLAPDLAAPRPREPVRHRAALATVLGLRLLAAPLALLGLSTLTVAVPDAYLVQAAMPVGINTLVVAHAYALDLRLAAGAVASSTAIVLAAALGAAAW
ncbi:MAG: hypothetical protein M3296_02135, partial [Actinomycetota bacterium]|nr:hypothetical protein [Actinomycetota bacterium]